MNVLIMAAHPDDEILGCAGTIQKLKEREDVEDIYVCIVCESCTARNRTDIDRMKECSRKANTLLGVKEVIFLDYKDQMLDRVPILELNKKIENIVRKTNAEMVFTHYSKDLNRDHRIVSEATRVATRPSVKQDIMLFEYEVLSTTELTMDEIFKPNTYSIISTGQLYNKGKAFSFYMSERNNMRSTDILIAKAKVRGAEVSSDLAEAFIMIRGIL